MSGRSIGIGREAIEPVGAREHLDRDAVAVGVSRCRADVEAEQRQCARDGREQPGAVRGHDRACEIRPPSHQCPLHREVTRDDQLPVAGQLVECERGPVRGRHRVEVLVGGVTQQIAERGAVLGDRRGHDRALRDHRVRLDPQLAQELRLVRAPRGRAGRSRVRERERVEQVEPLGVADGAGEAGDRDLIVEVTPGAGVGQQEVVLDEPDQVRGTGVVQADARRDLARDRRADVRVVTGAALADVVQQRAEKQDVGTRAACDVAVEAVPERVGRDRAAPRTRPPLRASAGRR